MPQIDLLYQEIMRGYCNNDLKPGKDATHVENLWPLSLLLAKSKTLEHLLQR